MSSVQSSTGSSGATTSLVQASTGPVSGINYSTLIQDLVASQQEQVTNLQNNISTIQSKEAAYSALDANLAPVASTLQTLGQASTFQQYQVQTSDASQLSVTAGSNATPGSYQFQVLQLAQSQSVLSRGYANDDEQTLGTGTLTISPGGSLDPQTLLSALNGGEGVQAGEIQITDMAGHTADVNLSSAYSVSDVLNAINNNGVADVKASTDGGQIVLTDTSGGSGTLSVSDVDGGQTAEGLGISGSSSTGTLTGQEVYQATSNTLLSEVNDGNGISSVSGSPTLEINLSNGSQLTVNLSKAETVGDVVNDINNASGNNGSLTASISNGALQLTDNTTGSGTLSVADESGTSAAAELGLNVAANGNTITGNQLLSGINSVLLRNLNGGQGITQTGEITLQDRTGLTATINLSDAQSLDQVINAINSATTTGGQKLHLTASIDSSGNGIQVTDTSGSAANNLVIEDDGSSTLASQLGITVNAAQSSVDSGSLNLQYVNDATSLSTYAPGGTAVPQGTFTITDSAGNSSKVNVTSATTTVGDLISLINSTSGIDIHAQLNSTGDGISLIDDAGGSGQLTVTDAGSGTTAKDLGLAGTGTANSNGQSEIDGRQAAVIDITSSDTLNSLVQKINATGVVSASVVDDGSQFAPERLELTSNNSGQAGQFFINESGINLGLQTTTQAQNALLQVGSGTSGYVQSSSTNTFNNAQPGLTVQALSVGQSPDTATVSLDTSSIVSDIQSFVTNYNSFVSQATTLTAFNTTTGTGAALEGSPTVTNAETQLSSLVTQLFGSSGSSAVQSLVDLGITVNSNGTLSLDTDTLQSVLTSDPTAVSNFFTTSKTGFAAVATQTVDSVTDSTTGTFALASNALADSVTTYQNRITELNDILENQEELLTQTFANLESSISAMQSEQKEIALIAPISSDGSTGTSAGSSNSSSSSSSSG